MTRAGWPRLDRAGRAAAPVAVTLLLVLVSVTPLGIPQYGPIAPQLALAGVFFWAIHRPELMPHGAVFVIGLLQDVVTDVPLGLSALVYLVVAAGLARQRRLLAGRAFHVLWCAFLIVAMLAAIAQWVIFSAVAGRLAPPGPALFQALTTTALYPLLGWLFVQVQHGFLTPAR